VLGRTVAHGLRPSARPSGTAAQSTRHAHPRGHRAQRDRGGMAGPGWPADEVRRGWRREHEVATESLPDKEWVAEAHPSSGSTASGKKGGGSSTFQGGGRVNWPGRAAMGVLQLAEETGEVRDHLTEEKGARGSSSPWRGKMTAAVA
jgi:hypothetical protein